MYLKSILLKAIICVFLIALSFQISKAQYDKLLDDPNITWAADFTIDHNFSLSIDDSKESVMLTKLYKDPSVNDYPSMDNWVIDWVYQSALDGKVECFEDPGLTKPISPEEINNMVSYIDTITTFSADTYEEQITIVKGSLNPEEITMLRTNQVIYYNKKSKNFETKLISLAPIVVKDSKSKPLFWIKMNEKKAKNFNIHNADITWGALVYSKSNPLELNFTNVIKNMNNFDFRTRIYKQVIKEEKKAESNRGFGCNSFLTSKEVEELYTSRDTVITFNPDTYEETVQVISNSLAPKEVSQFRLVQEWYYNTKTKKLSNRLKAIAPIVGIHDESGNFKYSRPMYYIRYE